MYKRNINRQETKTEVACLGNPSIGLPHNMLIAKPLHCHQIPDISKHTAWVARLVANRGGSDAEYAHAVAVSYQLHVAQAGAM